MAHYLTLLAKQPPPPPAPALQEELVDPLSAVVGTMLITMFAASVGTFLYGRTQGRGVLPSIAGGVVAGVGTQIAWYAGGTVAYKHGAVPGLAAASVPLVVGVGGPIALLKK